MLIVLRDQKMPMPAGAILISPWLDLTHSFPSMNDGGSDDYLPSYGFMQRPSMSWPPPNAEELGIVTRCAGKILQAINSPPVADSTNSVDERAIEEFFIRQATATTQAGHLEPLPEHHAASFRHHSREPHPGQLLTVKMDGVIVELKDQIHMYTSNEMLSHPLVSPVLQPSLGGLPPLLVLVGGGEMLRDEQIYFAHKAANPTAYPPGEKYMERHDPEHKIIGKYRPTYVQLQVWDHLCHVTPTLSFTPPAKYMYRSIAQFGAWALSRAQEASIDIPDWSTSSSGNVDYPGDSQRSASQQQQGFAAVGKAGDPLPPFHHHMIRQLIDSHGNIHPLPHESQLPALRLRLHEIGEPQVGPVRRWMNAKQEWDTKYSSLKKKILKSRVEELVLGIEELAPGETPPPTSLAARRSVSIRRVRRPFKKSRALAFWSSIANRHDEKALRESGEYAGRFRPTMPRPASETRVVTDVGQSNESQREITKRERSHREPSVASSRYSDISPGHLANAEDANDTVGGESNGPIPPISVTSDAAADHSLHPSNIPPRSPLREASPWQQQFHQPQRSQTNGVGMGIPSRSQTVTGPTSATRESSEFGWETPRETISALPSRRDLGLNRTKSSIVPRDVPDRNHTTTPTWLNRPKSRVSTPDEDMDEYSQYLTSRYGQGVTRLAPPAPAKPNRRNSPPRPSFNTARGSLRRHYKGKGLADEFNSTGPPEPSETEPFPPFSESANASVVSPSRFDFDRHLGGE